MSASSNYSIIAFITTNRNRILGGSQLILYAETEEEQKTLVQDIAKATKSDVTKLKTGDYLILKG